MNWFRIICDGVLMSAVFNLLTAVLWREKPECFVHDYPRRIRKMYEDSGRKEPRCFPYILCISILLLVYAAFSMHDAGVCGFWNCFLAAYIQVMLINLGDFFGLDILFRERVLGGAVLPGTDPDDVFYTRKGWCRELGLPEHFILWPFFICPLYAAIEAALAWIL